MMVGLHFRTTTSYACDIVAGSEGGTSGRVAEWQSGRVQVTVSSPIAISEVLAKAKTGDKWQVAKILREMARKAILQNCSEPDLGFE